MQNVVDAPALHATVVVDRREPAPGIVVLGLDAPGIAASVRPGQFLMALPPAGVRAATALAVYEAGSETGTAAGRISVMLIVVGPRTRELAELTPGRHLDVLAPLGNGFFLAEIPRTVAIVAGGVGLASVLLAAKRCVDAGARTELLYGARTRAGLVDVELFERLGVTVRCATEDGTAGERGYVTALLERGEPPGSILACGPDGMLRATAAVAQRLGVPAQLSLEETFGCGVGACWGCVVRLSRDSAQAPAFPEEDGRDFVNARVCKEGPVFWAHELRW